VLSGVNTPEIIAALDTQIARLQDARTLIAGSAEPKQRGWLLASAKIRSEETRHVR
jgi:hypothetical protein